MTTQRECGGCTQCCKLLGIAEIGKPAGKWCPHCAPGRGCEIYVERPNECAQFACAWLLDESLGPEWKPDKSKIVLVTDVSKDRVIVHVDSINKAAWKQTPYLETLMRLMRSRLAQGSQIFIAYGGRTSILLPDGEHELGVLADDDVIEIEMMAEHGAYMATVRKAVP